jgi:hypothetical protein
MTIQTGPDAAAAAAAAAFLWGSRLIVEAELPLDRLPWLFSANACCFFCRDAFIVDFYSRSTGSATRAFHRKESF